MSLQEKTGSNDHDVAKAMSSNSTGLVIGYEFSGTNVVFNGGGMAKNPNARSEMAVIKYDHSNNVIWSSKIGFHPIAPLCTQKDAFIDAITMNSSGEVFVAGRFQYKDISFSGSSVLSKSCDNDADIFIVKYSSTGAVLWSEKIETESGSDRIVSMSVTNSGDLLVSGNFWGSEFSWHTHTIYRTDRTAAFIGSINPTNGQTNWIKAFNGSFITQDLKTDALNNIWWLSNCYGTHNNLDGTIINSQGKMDLVLAKLDANGNVLETRHFYGPGNELGTGLSIDSNNKVWLCGRTNSISIANTSLSNSGAIEGHYISFLLGLDQNLFITNTVQISGNGHDGPKVSHLCHWDNGNISVVGVTDGNTGQFGTLSHNLNGPAFIMTMDANGSPTNVSSFDMKKPGDLHLTATPTGAMVMGNSNSMTINGTVHSSAGGNDVFLIAFD